MGLFTTIEHEWTSWEDGQPEIKHVELQIKCGWDDMRRFRVGDEVPARIIEDYPGEGYLLDGVYHGFNAGGNVDGHWWVIIKDSRVHSICRSDPRRPAEEREALEELFDIREPDPELWPDELWEAKFERERIAREKREQWMRENPDKSPMSYYITTKMQEDSLMSKILPVRENIENQ